MARALHSSFRPPLRRGIRSQIGLYFVCGVSMVAAVRRVQHWWQGWQQERGEHPLVQPAMFPEAYTWFVFVSAMDLLLTWVILHYDGGREANALANAILQRFDLLGLVAYKFLI